jgi:hypothetical protein
MNRRDARLRNELIGIIVLKICILAILWAVFVRGTHVPVNADAVARFRKRRAEWPLTHSLICRGCNSQ